MHFCTIITADHLFKAQALFDSLTGIHTQVQLHVLSIDSCPQLPAKEGFQLYTTKELSHINHFHTIREKYAQYPDKFRWSLKPIFLQHILQHIHPKIIYLDSDLYFFGDYAFLFDLLNTHNVLLTPHHYSRDASKEQNWFEANYKVGLFNAGFVGVNSEGITLMDWWASCCAYRCEKNPLRGMFDDQRYLDLLPVMDERVHILRHKGCNVADWNRQENPRSLQNNALVLSNQYPLIFIHFNYTTIRAIVQAQEPLLKTHLNTYFQHLKSYKPDLTLSSMYGEDKFLDKLKYKLWKTATQWGW